MLYDKLRNQGLSDREAEIAEWIAKDLTDKEIAHHLFVTLKTIKFHVASIKKKLGSNSRNEIKLACLPYMGVNKMSRLIDGRTREQVWSDLVVGALEGGSNYWYKILNHNKTEVGAEYLSQIFEKPGAWLLIKDNAEQLDKPKKVTSQDLEEAWDLLKKDYDWIFARICQGQDDANDADIFFQLAVFRKVIFG